VIDSLLTPAEGEAERVLEGALRADIDIAAVGTLWNPTTCPAEVLPFLAWGVAITHWDSAWTEAEKRAAILGAIPYHMRKGTRAAVEEVLARFNPLLQLVEWWQATPPRPPHTFEVRAPSSIPADFLTPETAEAIIRDVAAAKPLRSHFDFVQVLEAQARLFMASGAMGGSVFRHDYTTFHDTSRDWSAVLQTEDGEPVSMPDGSDFLETL
jgi:phage tail P2-like protein